MDFEKMAIFPSDEIERKSEEYANRAAWLLGRKSARVIGLTPIRWEDGTGGFEFVIEYLGCHHVYRPAFDDLES